MALGWSENQVYDPITQKDYTVYGHDNATQALLTFNTNQANLDLAKKQNDWNVQQWNRENEYNSPSNQVKLLLEAGLNPNIYDVGSSRSGNVTSADMHADAPQLTNNDAARAEYPFKIADTTLNALGTIAQEESLRAGIAESKQRQRLADGIYPYQVQAAALANENTLANTQFTDAQRMLAGANLRSENLFRVPRLGQIRAQTAESEQNARTGAAQESVLTATEKQIGTNIMSVLEKLPLEKQNLRASAAQMFSSAASMNTERELNQWRLNFMRKFNYDPQLSSPLTALVNLGLSSPEQFQNVVKVIGDNLGRFWDTGKDAGSFGLKTFQNWMQNNSWFNPHGAGRGF